MSDLQEQAIEIIKQMPEENLSVFVKFMQIFIQPKSGTSSEKAAKPGSNRIGIAEGECLCDPEYDIDEYNAEIAKMFEMI